MRCLVALLGVAFDEPAELGVESPLADLTDEGPGDGVASPGVLLVVGLGVYEA
jgi:hypothetical protein